MSGLTPEDRRWLDAAARMAMPYLGTTGENPTVGALVVDEARQVLVGRGVTAPGGRPHAEPQALQEAAGRARGRTLYVTLEPCNHWGRTPPCADAVIRSGVRRVIVGVADPDPRTAGEGIQRLASAGIDVVVADHAPSRRLHEGFLSRTTRGRPFVVAKLAVSADGMIGLPDQPKLAITGEVARRWTHMQRALSDAVMVGARTAEIDDPLLTVRLPGLADRINRRIVMLGRRGLNARIEMIHGVSPLPTIVIAPEGASPVFPRSVEVIEVAARDGRPDPKAAMAALAEHHVATLLVEGGATVIEALLAADLVDRFHVLSGAAVVGPRGVPATMLGGIEGRITAAGLTEVDRRTLGDDKLRTFERA